MTRPSSTQRPRSFGRADVRVPTGAEASAIDRRAIEGEGIPSRVLMENAGRGAALLLDRLYPSGKVLVLVGSGNNGGDGVVLARTLHLQGREVELVRVAERPDPDPLLHGWRVPTHPFPEDEAGAAALLARFDLLVDALLGTGVRGAPRPPFARAVEAMNDSGKPIVALDLPSGVEADTGAIQGVAVRASVTVAFGFPKVGSILFPGRGVSGRLLAIEIGFPPDAVGEVPVRLITSGWAEAARPLRQPVTHKKAEGRVLILAGSEGTAGAAILAGLGALRAGAGYVRIASPAGNREILQRSLPEAIFVDAGDQAALEAGASDSDALLLGPGIGLDGRAAERVNLLLGVEGPSAVTLDADALTLLAAGRPAGWPGRLPASAHLLTPHPGEMARLLSGGDDPGAEAILARARAGVARWGATVLLKGAPSVVAEAGEGGSEAATVANGGDSAGEPAAASFRVSTTGSSDLARAGMGDLLGGVIVAFQARGMGAADAAALALHYTGRAASLAGGGESLLPSDIAAALGAALGEPPENSDTGFPFVTLDLDPAR